MARTAAKVRDLVAEDGDLEEALERILDVSEAEGEVRWTDVNDDLTSGQWGRLIEKGVLVEGEGEGFRVADPEGVRDGLAPEDESDEPEADSSWSTWDKVAGLLALSLFPGYYVSGIRDSIGHVLNAVFGPVDAVLPFYAVILVLAVLTGLYSTLLQANLMDMDKIAHYQEQMQAIQDKQEAARERGDEAELERLREEQMDAMGDQLGMFKEQFRPMAWIMLLTIPVFLWMYWKLGTEGPAAIPEAEQLMRLPLAGDVTLNAPIGFLPMPTWIVWYFLCSLGFTQIIRKALNIQTAPSSS